MIVTLPGYGTFEITNEKIGELVQWLQTNQAVKINEQTAVNEPDGKGGWTGRTLINE